MEPNAIANLDVMLDHRVRADADVIPNLVLFTNQRPVPGLKVIANAIARIDDAVRADDGAGAEPGFELARRAAARRLANNRIVADARVLAKNGRWGRP